MDILLLVLRLLLAGLLYAFLGAVFLILWRDFRHAPSHRAAAQPKTHLIVLQVAEDDAHQPPIGTVFPLRPVTSIGRAPSNTVVIPDTYASSQHALLTLREGQWWLEDQHSRNGTTLNGRLIESPTVVSVGDIIGVGRTQLKFEVS
jgi:hypothetical protein